MKKIAENKICIFYDNELTGVYKEHRIMLAEFKKSGEQNYVVVQNFQVIYESKQIEAIYYWIDFKVMM